MARAPDLDRLHLAHGTRAEVLRRLGRVDEAAAAYRRALDLAPDPVERRFLEDQLDQVDRRWGTLRRRRTRRPSVVGVGRWGEVLEAMHLAPRGARTVRLEVEERSDHQAMQRALGWASRGTGRTIAVSPIGRTGPLRSILDLDVRTGRYREDRDGQRVRCDGTTVFQEHRRGVWLRRPDVGEGPRPTVLRWTAPEVLLAVLAFDGIDAGEVLGRPVALLRGRPREDRVDPTGRALAPLTFFAPGDRVEVAVDEATGVLLAVRSWIHDEAVVDHRAVAFEVDGFAPVPSLFEPPPGDEVRNLEVHRVAMAADSLGHRLEAVEHPFRPARPEGPPPADEDVARRAIADAVEHLTDVDRNGWCPHLEDGDQLADAVGQAKASPFVGPRGATFALEDLAFRRADEAVATIRVEVARSPLSPITFVALVVDRGDRWVVARHSICQLLALAGVTCPPPAA